MDQLPHPLPPGFEIKQVQVEVTTFGDLARGKRQFIDGIAYGYIDGRAVNWREFVRRAHAWVAVHPPEGPP